MAKIADGEPFILHSSTESLDNKNAMTEQQWNQVVTEQKAKYYRKRPIDDVLAYMKNLEDNPEALLSRPPTDDSIQQPVNRGKGDTKQQMRKPSFNAKYDTNDT